MTLYQILTDAQTGLDIPCAYSHFSGENQPSSPPYVVYRGNGQDVFQADNTYYQTKNRYQIEYYFKIKDEDEEALIEQLLLDNGYRYEKSEDIFIEDEGVFVIYYII